MHTSLIFVLKFLFLGIMRLKSNFTLQLLWKHWHHFHISLHKKWFIRLETRFWHRMAGMTKEKKAELKPWRYYLHLQRWYERVSYPQMYYNYHSESWIYLQWKVRVVVMNICFLRKWRLLYFAFVHGFCLFF